MPPRRLSRFALSEAVSSNVDADKTIVSERVRFGFVARSDTIEHQVQDGDTLSSIAGRYYASLETPARLYWILADFQPDPIHDPTLAIDRSVIFVPSVNVVLTEILSERRRGL